MNQDVINKILEFINSPMAIKDGALEAFALTVYQKIQAKQTFEMPKVAYRSAINNQVVDTTNQTDVPLIMIIPVTGIIVKYDIPECGLLGLRSIQAMIQDAANTANIKAVMIYANTPGGTTSDLAETVDSIAALVPKKPVGLYGDGLLCSAGDYLSAPCTFVATTPKSSMIGNIGSVVRTMDYTGLMEKFGIKNIEIYGDLSFDKDLGFNDVLTGKPQKFKDMIVNPHNEMFVSDMKKYRPQIKEEALHGAVYLSEKAKEMGLVDMCCSFDDAMSYLISLIPQDNQSDNNNNQIQMKKVTITVHDTIAAGLKMVHKDAIVEDITETPAENQQQQQQPPTPETKPEEPKAETVSKADYDAKVAELEQVKADLAKRSAPGAEVTTPVVTTNKPAIQTQNSTEQSIEDLPHIKAAREALGFSD